MNENNDTFYKIWRIAIATMAMTLGALAGALTTHNVFTWVHALILGMLWLLIIRSDLLAIWKEHSKKKRKWDQ